MFIDHFVLLTSSSEMKRLTQNPCWHILTGMPRIVVRIIHNYNTDIIYIYSTQIQQFVSAQCCEYHKNDVHNDMEWQQ